MCRFIVFYEVHVLYAETSQLPLQDRACTQRRSSYGAGATPPPLVGCQLAREVRKQMSEVAKTTPFRTIPHWNKRGEQI